MTLSKGTPSFGFRSSFWAMTLASGDILSRTSEADKLWPVCPQVYALREFSIGRRPYSSLLTNSSIVMESGVSLEAQSALHTRQAV